MKTIAEIMRDRERAAEREKRIHRLTAEWEAGEYITAADAAKEIGMSPARFQALLRQERNRLPIEKKDLALELSGRFIMGNIESVFYDKGVNIELDFIKIHRLDWSAYIASTTTPQHPHAVTAPPPLVEPTAIPSDINTTPQKKYTRGAISARNAALLFNVSQREIQNWDAGIRTPHGYPGRGNILALKKFAMEYEAQKSIEKAALGATRPVSGGGESDASLDQYSYEQWRDDDKDE